ncbi:MAG TPA: hypothetical protein VFV25_02260 [Methylibium sp.]
MALDHHSSSPAGRTPLRVWLTAGLLGMAAIGVAAWWLTASQSPWTSPSE